jgi:hypothetical protein
LKGYSGLHLRRYWFDRHDSYLPPFDGDPGISDTEHDGVEAEIFCPAGAFAAS